MSRLEEDNVEHAETFEYAIRKDVRNNPIVREVDQRRQRELLSSLGIGAVLVLVVMFDAWQHFEHIRHGYAIDALQKSLAAEDEVRRHLRLERRLLFPVADDVAGHIPAPLAQRRHGTHQRGEPLFLPQPTDREDARRPRRDRAGPARPFARRVTARMRASSSRGEKGFVT